MDERRKRQRLSEDGDAVITTPLENDLDGPQKKQRKETNASAQRSLFVRSLPATATSASLTELFSQNYPLKHATVVLDPETKQSKGYGFVTFADAEDAARAKEEFNGHTFQGRKMKVEIAEPRSRDSKKVGEGKPKSFLTAEAAAIKKERMEKMADAKKPPKLIVRNLPWSIKEPEQLEVLFRPFGKVKHVTLPKVKDTQAGFGFIVMRGKKNAEKALAAVNGNLVDGRTLAVDWAVDKDEWENQKKAAEAEGPAAGEEDEDEDEADEDEDMEDGEDEEDEEDEDHIMASDAEDEDMEDEDEEDEDEDEESRPAQVSDNSKTLFIRNLPFTCLDDGLKEHFQNFGPVRYARVVMDYATDRPRGTGFVCFFNQEDADGCFRGAPRYQPTGANAIKPGAAPGVKHSILQDENADNTGLYTMEGRVLQISRAVDRSTAVKLTEEGTNFRTDRDTDKRKLYLLQEGTVAAGTPLYNSLAPSEVKMREDSAMQRKKLIQNNPTLHLSLTRLSVRNLPRNIDSKALKALAREAVVGFAKDVKEGRRSQLSKEEEARGGDEMREAEKQRKAKGKGIVRQAKIVFEGKEGAKVSEESGAGRSRGYGFLEYSSHRWALMGLRWLNGHAVEGAGGKKQRLIVEFAIENAQVVQRRKEKEEKARIRSKEVMEARSKAEAEGKKLPKKTLSKDALMAKTRKGMKGGKPGVKGPGNEKREFKKGDATANRKRKREEAANGQGKEGEEKRFKPGFPPGEEGRLARRQQILEKKRSYRKTRKQNK